MNRGSVSNNGSNNGSNSGSNNGNNSGSNSGSIWLKPSFYAHVINGIILFVVGWVMIKHFDDVRSLRTYELVTLLLTISLSLGVHGLMHLGFEQFYGYDLFNLFNFHASANPSPTRQTRPQAVQQNSATDYRKNVDKWYLLEVMSKFFAPIFSLIMLG